MLLRARGLACARNFMLFLLYCFFCFSQFLFFFFLFPEVSVAKRGKMSRGHSRKVFSKGANRVHPKNAMTGAGYVMRGGIRL